MAHPTRTSHSHPGMRMAADAEAMAGLGYEATVITNKDELMALKSAWEALYEQSGSMNPALSYAWIQHHVNTMPEMQLFIVTVRRADNTLVAVAPLKLSRSRRGVFRRWLTAVQFIGTEPDSTDEITFLLHPDADKTAVVKAVAGAINRHSSRWHLLDLKNCPDTGLLITLEEYVTAGAGKGVIALEDLSLTMALPETESEYDAVIYRKNLRKTLKNALNHLTKDTPDQEVTFQIHGATPQTQAQLGRILDAHIDYWQQKGIKSELKRYSELKDFYQALYDGATPDHLAQNPLLLFTLHLGSTLVSAQIGLWHQGTYFAKVCWYNRVYCRYRPGLLLFEAVIRFAIQHGAGLFHFGKGDQQYKHLWPVKKRPLYRLSSGASGWVRGVMHLEHMLQALRERWKKEPCGEC